MKGDKLTIQGVVEKRKIKKSDATLATELFSMLPLTAQDAIIELTKCLLAENKQ